MPHLVIKVIGRVQGVGFRAHTAQQAQRLGLVGYVRNEKDGSLRIEAQGPEDALNQLLNWCRKGPVSAQVQAVETAEGAGLQAHHFEVRR